MLFPQITLSKPSIAFSDMKVKVAQSCPSLCDPMELASFFCPWNSPGQNSGVGSHSLLQEIFPTQGSNPGFPHYRQILYHLSQQGSPTTFKSMSNVTSSWFNLKCLVQHLCSIFLSCWEKSLFGGRLSLSVSFFLVIIFFSTQPAIFLGGIVKVLKFR